MHSAPNVSRIGRASFRSQQQNGVHVNKVRISLACNIVLAIAEPIAWLTMVFSRGTAALTAMGLYTLKFFTVLSNLLLGVASLVFAVYLVRYLRRGLIVPKWAHLLKYAATVAVTVTLMTVLLFLGPTMGYAAMFVGVNLWLHLVFPVLGIVEFIFLDTQRGITFKETLFGVVPVLLYGIFYYGNILINGVGERPYTNDWYGFTMFGVQYMPVVLAVMLLATWLLAIIIRAANATVRKRR